MAIIAESIMTMIILITAILYWFNSLLKTGRKV